MAAARQEGVSELHEGTAVPLADLSLQSRCSRVAIQVNRPSLVGSERLMDNLCPDENGRKPGLNVWPEANTG
jgi:hypothetical protein